jgi:hypothetical protein
MNISVKLDDWQRIATETGNRLAIYFVPDDGWQVHCGPYAATHPDLMLALETMTLQRKRVLGEKT